MKRILIAVLAILLCSGLVVLFGYNGYRKPISLLVKNEKLAQEISRLMQKYNSDEISFLIMAGKREDLDIVYFFAGNSFTDPQRNICLHEWFLNYKKVGAIKCGNRIVSLAYIGIDTIPDMSYLFDESVLDLPFPKNKKVSEEDWDYNRPGVFDFVVFGIKDGIVDELNNVDNLTQIYPREFECFTDNDDYFLTLFPSVQTYKVFDGVKETIGNYVCSGDTLRLFPKYYSFTSSLLRMPVIAKAREDLIVEEPSVDYLVWTHSSEAIITCFYSLDTDSEPFRQLHRVYSSRKDLLR